MRKISLPIVFSFVILCFVNFQNMAAGTECDSVNTALTSKFRFLGGWDAMGTPDYLQPDPDQISQSLIDYVLETLPENGNFVLANPKYFGVKVKLNTELKEESEVYLTMVHEGAAWTNTLGYYTYELNDPPQTVYDIDSMVIIFPNLSQPDAIKPGDKVLLGNFPANTGIGYFLIAQGWVGDTVCLKSHIVFTDTDLNTFSVEEYKQQSLLLSNEQENKFLLGFEDKKRLTADNDFNDAVFYITASPGAIDTTNIPTIPTALLSGDTTICDENAKAQLKVEFTGQAPWTIVYNDGTQEIEIKDINERVYVFETTLRDTITLLSVKDKDQFGIVYGQAVVDLSLPTAKIEEHANKCGEKESEISVALTGKGPWEINYSMDGELKTATSGENLLILKINQTGTFELLGVKDTYCSNLASGIVEIEFFESPTAVIYGDTTLCNPDAEATIQIGLTGTAPFSIVYSDGETETTITTTNNLYAFTSKEFKTFTLISVDDANCSGEVTGSSVVSDGSQEIQAEIDTDENSCFGEDIELTLLGSTNNLTVVWSTEGSGSFDNQDQLSATYTPAENETGVIVFYAELDNGCSVKTISKEVNIIEKIDASFSYSPSQDLLINTLITFIPASNGFDEYNWDFGDGNSSNANMASTEYDTSGIFTVSLTVNIAGCEGEGSSELEVMSKDELYVPNAFNPSAQNPENQVVKVYGSNVDESGFAFKIINRWGKVMYKTNSFAEANSIGWNGVNNNNNEQQELNVFTYLLKGRFIEGEEFEKVGTITQVK